MNMLICLLLWSSPCCLLWVGRGAKFVFGEAGLLLHRLLLFHVTAVGSIMSLMCRLLAILLLPYLRPGVGLGLLLFALQVAMTMTVLCCLVFLKLCLHCLLCPLFWLLHWMALLCMFLRMDSSFHLRFLPLAVATGHRGSAQSSVRKFSPPLPMPSGLPSSTGAAAASFSATTVVTSLGTIAAVSPLSEADARRREIWLGKRPVDDGVHRVTGDVPLRRRADPSVGTAIDGSAPPTSHAVPRPPAPLCSPADYSAVPEPLIALPIPKK